MILLHRTRSLAYYVDDLYVLGHGTCDPVQSGKLAHAMCGDDAARFSSDTSIAVGGVCRVEFILIANPLQTFNIEDRVEKLQIEVARNPKDGIYADLMDSETRVSGLDSGCIEDEGGDILTAPTCTSLD